MDASQVEDETAGRAADLRMSDSLRRLTQQEIIALTGAEPARLAEPAIAISCAAALPAAREDAVVFAQDETTLRDALASQAGIVLAARSLRESAVAQNPVACSDPRLLWVEDARLAFAVVAGALRPMQNETSIHLSAVIAQDTVFGVGVHVGPGVVIEDDVVLGDNVWLEARVVLHAGVRLGNRVEVHAGSVLGGVGFGWVRNRHTGEYVRFPQQGRLVIEDDVCIGANCTIDRGALGETRIGAGTKIDNLVHIAHSCTIGRRVVIAAQTGIAGSSAVGDDAVIAGQVGIADHVHIGEGVVLGAKCGVPSNKVLRGVGQVFWGIPRAPYSAVPAGACTASPRIGAVWPMRETMGWRCW